MKTKTTSELRRIELTNENINQRWVRVDDVRNKLIKIQCILDDIEHDNAIVRLINELSQGKED